LIYNDQLNKGRNSERDLKRLFDEASRKWESKKRYENEVWSEACAVDSVWTWLSLGITCTLTIGSASDVISAEEIKRSREQTYSKKKDLVRQYESKVNEINVEIKKFEASLRSEKANLQHFKNDIRRLKTKQINLSTLNHDFKSNAQELSKLVTSVQSSTFNHGEVSRRVRELKIKLKITTDRIDEVKEVLGIDDAAVTRLKTAFSQLEDATQRLAAKFPWS